MRAPTGNRRAASHGQYGRVAKGRVAKGREGVGKEERGKGVSEGGRANKRRREEGTEMKMRKGKGVAGGRG